jgi:RimJ/RimL family protein N-acetyltransferase
MDNVAFGFAEPQEDEFALCSLTGRAFPMAWAFPRGADHYGRYLTLRDTSAGEAIYDRTSRIPSPYTEANAEEWLALLARIARQQGQPVHWAIRNQKGCLIGACGFDGFQVGKSHRAEVGYWLAKHYWGRGIMTAVVREICQFAFNEWNLVKLVLGNEPLRRGNGGKPHWAEFCYRTGGETVYVCSRYPNGITEAQYKGILAGNPKAKGWGWRTMQRNPGVYVKGRIRHPDHATITLHGWHRVVMNTEGQSRAMRNVAFLD